MKKKLAPNQLINITFFRFPQSFIWTALLLIIIPAQILTFVPPEKKGTYLSIVLTAGALVTLFSQPLMGAISDHFKRRIPFIVFGSFLAASFLFSMIFVKSFIVFMLIYLFLQLTIDIAEAPHYALISDIVPVEQLGQASGFSSLMTFGGQISGPLLAGFLIQKGHLSNFYLLAIAILLTSALLLKAKVKEGIYEKPEFNLFSFIKSFKINLRSHPNFAKVLALQFFLMLALYTITGFLQFYIKDVLGIEKFTQATGILIAIATISGALSVYYIGKTVDRIGTKKLLNFASVLIIVIISVLIFNNSFTIALLLAVFFGLVQGIFLTTTLVLAINNLPEKESHGKDLGIWVAASIIPQIIAPAIGGPLLDQFNMIKSGLGYQVVFGLAILYIAVAMAIIRQVEEAYAKPQGQN